MNRKDRRADASRERGALKALVRTARSMRLGRNQSSDGVPESACGHCGKLLDGASSASGAKACPGALSICISCAGVNIFLTDLTLGKLTDEQLQIHPQYDELVEHQNMIRAMHTRSLNRKPGDA